MDDWNKKKLLKIQKKKEEIEKKNLSCSECKFKPSISEYSLLKRENEGVSISDRLYLEFFSLRKKREDMIEDHLKQLFRPNINH